MLSIAHQEQLEKELFVYRKADLDELHQEIMELHNLALKLHDYLRDPAANVGEYRQ